MKRRFLYILPLIFIVGFLILAEVDRANLFRATVAPGSSPFEDSELNLSEINLENLLPEATPGVEVTPESLLADLSAEASAQEEAPLSGMEEDDELTLAEIQEILDDITERIDVIEQEIAELTEESGETPAEEENGDDEDDEEEEEKDDEKDDEEEKEEEKEEERKKDKPKRGKKRSSGGGASGPSYCQKSPDAQPSRDKIIINEVTWMGTGNSASDEWLELKNIANSSINLSGWQLLDKGSQIKIIFTNDQVIPARGFYLLERTNDNSVPDIGADFIYKGALNNTNEALYLFGSNCQLQDEVIAEPDWPAGDKKEKRSMERGNDLSWYSYFGQGENGIMGTPKAENSQPPLPQPILEVSPQTIEFSIIEFATPSQSETFIISNRGEGILEWGSIVEYATPSFEGIKWLAINPDSGSISADDSLEVLVSPDISNLIKGVYNAKIIIKAEGTEGSSKEVEVVLNVAEVKDSTPPEIVFDLEPVQTSLSFTISWTGIDPIGSATPSGIETFYLQYDFIPSLNTATPIIGETIALWYQDGQGWEVDEILELGEEKDTLALLGKNEYTYDFQIQAEDKAENLSDWQEASTTINLSKKVLINEIQIAAKEDEKEEFVELYNPNESNLDLTGWYLQRKTAKGSSFSSFAPGKLFSGKIIKTKSYFLIAREGSSFSELADIVTDYPLTENNTLVLKDPNREIKDKVGWGVAQDFETAPAESPLPNQSIERKELGLDTNDNSQDFKINDTQPQPTQSRTSILLLFLKVFHRLFPT